MFYCYANVAHSLCFCLILAFVMRPFVIVFVSYVNDRRLLSFVFDCYLSDAPSLWDACSLCFVVHFLDAGIFTLVIRALFAFLFDCHVSDARSLGLCLIIALVMHALLVCV